MRAASTHICNRTSHSEQCLQCLREIHHRLYRPRKPMETRGKCLLQTYGAGGANIDSVVKDSQHFKIEGAMSALLCYKYQCQVW